jgi:hypothetical protein
VSPLFSRGGKEKRDSYKEGRILHYFSLPFFFALLPPFVKEGRGGFSSPPCVPPLLKRGEGEKGLL